MGRGQGQEQRRRRHGRPASEGGMGDAEVETRFDRVHLGGWQRYHRGWRGFPGLIRRRAPSPGAHLLSHVLRGCSHGVRRGWSGGGVLRLAILVAREDSRGVQGPVRRRSCHASLDRHHDPPQARRDRSGQGPANHAQEPGETGAATVLGVHGAATHRGRPRRRAVLRRRYLRAHAAAARGARRPHPRAGEHRRRGGGVPRRRPRRQRGGPRGRGRLRGGFAVL